MLSPKERKPHKVTISFTINVAPEFVSKLKSTIEQYFWTFLGYPTDILGLNFYSFDKPDLPEKIEVDIKKED